MKTIKFYYEGDDFMKNQENAKQPPLWLCLSIVIFFSSVIFIAIDSKRRA